MDRRVLVSAMVALSFALGCGRSAQEQAKPPEPAQAAAPATTAAAPAPVAETAQAPAAEPCTKFDKERADIKVAQDATVDLPCLEFSRKVTKKVVWTVDPPATGVDITFKKCQDADAPAVYPGKPDPEGRTRKLLEKHTDKIDQTSVVCYTVTVTFPPPTEPVSKDPRLIINP